VKYKLKDKLQYGVSVIINEIQTFIFFLIHRQNPLYDGRENKGLDRHELGRT